MCFVPIKNNSRDNNSCGIKQKEARIKFCNRTKNFQPLKSSREKAPNPWKPQKSNCIICRQTITTQLTEYPLRYDEYRL